MCIKKTQREIQALLVTSRLCSTGREDRVNLPHLLLRLTWCLVCITSGETEVRVGRRYGVFLREGFSPSGRYWQES